MNCVEGRLDTHFALLEVQTGNERKNILLGKMWIHPVFYVPHPVASAAVRQLANVDYNVATRLSHTVANVVPWALDHNLYWLSDISVLLLGSLDQMGHSLIAFVAWLVLHTH